MSWLWKSDASSPASFEKALSKLSAQIDAANLSLETTRARSRRSKALWTLYTTLTYLVSVLILVLVIGPQDWSIPHYGGLIGGPAVIYSVRLLLTTAFGWRANRQQSHLNHLQKQREDKITALKKATKFDSTQELLQKYGGSPPQKETPSKQSSNNAKPKPRQSMDHVQRTGLPPPPTANIRRPQAAQVPSTPPQRPSSRDSLSAVQRSPQTPVVTEEPGFAPNAFTSAPPSRALYEQTPHWYDRILDVMLGEDENAAKNRLVMLCQNCRLVNGQAPPGVKTLEQLGKWKCGSCGSWNGVESEGAKVVREMTEQAKTNRAEGRQPVRHEDDSVDADQLQHVADGEGEDTGAGTGIAREEDASTTKRATRSSGLEPVEGL